MRRVGDVILVTILALLAGFAAVAKAHCAPLFELSVVNMRDNQPVSVGFAPMKVRARLRIHGEFTRGEICFVVDGPEFHQTCVENDSGKPFPPLVTRDFVLRGEGQWRVHVQIGNARSNDWVVELRQQGEVQ